MNLARFFSRICVLILLWLLPLLFYVGVALIALHQNGWLIFMAWTLPLVWTAAWLVGRWWRPPALAHSRLVEPLTPQQFWTPHDTAALEIVDKFRQSLPEIDRDSIADFNRYIGDAQALSQALAEHYYPKHGSQVAYRPLTIVEILSVIHLSIEDLEAWMLDSVPGSNLVTIGQLEKVPTIVRAIDVGQKMFFLATSITNPAKLLSYPLWRSAGRVTVEIQNEAMRAFYQHYLRQVSFYLIEMYSGRLRGGSKQYRRKFGPMSVAAHAANGDAELLIESEATDTTIAVMGQVKAGKSSLINALMRDIVAEVSVLPQTRQVQRYELDLDLPTRSDGQRHLLTLLDTPGYNEADITRQQRTEIRQAVEMADIVLLVLSASSPAKDADVQMVRELQSYYREHPHLKPPPILAILTHIDQLRPVREWSPPYDWRHPTEPKAQSIADAVAYVHELFGASIVDVTCVFTGHVHLGDTSVSDEVVPLIMTQLNHGHSAAVLKAFYRGLSRRRYEQLTTQLTNLIRTLTKSLGFPSREPKNNTLSA